MATDENHIALPKLYGAPAYARPIVIPVAPVDRPFDPDDFPLEVAQTEEERELLAEVTARPYSSEAGDPVGIASGGGAGEGSQLRGRPFRLGSITSRFRGDDGTSAGA